MWGTTYHTLVWYGPGAGAAIIAGAGSSSAGILARGRLAGSGFGAGLSVNAKATRLVNAPATVTGAGSVVSAQPRGRGRPTATVSIGSRPSADDIAQAVWGARQTITLEAGTMAKAMRLTAAIAANRVVTDPTAGTFTVYDDDDTTVLAAGDLWQNAAGTTPYAGAGAERRDRLT